MLHCPFTAGSAKKVASVSAFHARWVALHGLAILRRSAQAEFAALPLPSLRPHRPASNAPTRPDTPQPLFFMPPALAPSRAQRHPSVPCQCANATAAAAALAVLLGAAMLTVAAVAASGEAAARAPTGALAAKPVKPARATKAGPNLPASKPLTKALTKRQQQDQAKALALAVATAETISAGQLDVAARVLTGTADCEFKQQVQVLAVTGQLGHFTLDHQGKRFHLSPRETATGAVRLEDAATGMVWLQIPSKSMLMNARLGQRVVDNCLHSEQRAALAAVADAANSLGILATPVPAQPPAAASSAASAPDESASAPAVPASAPAVPASAPAVPASAPAVPASAPAAPASAPAVPASAATSSPVAKLAQQRP